MKLLSLLNQKSTLSPDSDPICTPSVLAERMQHRGIRLSALTDLNASMNCPAFYAECSKHKIACLFGMEAWTCDSLKTLVLFPDLKLAVDFSSAWYDTLPNHTGEIQQFYVDENGEIIGELKKELKNASTVSFERLRKKVRELGGITAYVKQDEELLLDTGNELLFTDESKVNLKAVERAFEKLQVPQAVPLSF